MTSSQQHKHISGQTDASLGATDADIAQVSFPNLRNSLSVWNIDLTCYKHMEKHQQAQNEEFHFTLLVCCLTIMRNLHCGQHLWIFTPLNFILDTFASISNHVSTQVSA